MVTAPPGRAGRPLAERSDRAGGCFDQRRRDPAPAADIRDEDLRHAYVQALASGIGAVPYLSKYRMLKEVLNEGAWEYAVERLFDSGAYKTVGSKMKYRQNLFDVENFKALLRLERGTNVAEVHAIGRYRQVLVGPMLIGMALGFLVTNIKGGESAGQVMLSALTALNDTLDAVTTYRTVASSLRGLGVTDPGVILQLTLRYSYSFSSSVAKAAAVGAVIGVAATWSFFFAAWGKGGLSVDSVEFNNLLAGAISATLVIVLTFLVSLTVVGAIILAVFGDL